MKTVVNVEGMMCPMSEKNVKEAIEKNFSVESVTASHEAKKVEITSAEPLDFEKIKAVVADAGYTATGLAE